MSRATKFLAATVLLLLPIIQACGDDIPPPPPTGSIDGLVSIEGQGADNISVSLSNGASATTANGGMFRFDGVEAGTYTVTISNYPADATFNQTSATATIATEGQAVTVNFPGTWIRTSSIMGTVTVEDEGLGGVTVKLSGTSDSETLTDASGQYAFSGLRAGAYTVEISGFDDEDVGFGSTSSSATVAAGESKVVSFEGTYLRTSAIIGQVTGDNDPLAGVTVSLQGRGEDRSVTTNASGNYRFEQLRRGDYAVGISGYDTDEVDFDATSQNVTVAFGETTSVPFKGTLLRTAGIEGRVMIEGVGLSGVSVSISGNGETKEAVTNSAGQYAFDRLHAGDYSVVISGYDDDEYGFEATSQTVTVELQETAKVEFDGIMLRTAAIEGEVTVGDDNTPLADVKVTVKGGPKGEEHSAVTGSDGAFAVEELHAGDYSVTISDYDEKEWGFDPTTKSVTVGLRETAEVAFQGEALRTASITGRVSVANMGIAGVTVTLTGEEDREGETNADGQFGFTGLAAGDYTLAITGYDEMEYAFDPTSKSITLALDEWKNENFMGRSLRTAMIAGSVTVEGAGLAGIAVTLIKVISANSGEILGTKPTDSDGAYSFGDLLAGAYQVMIAGYADEHDFAAGTEWTGAAMTDQTTTVDFPATIIRTASVSGMVTVDGDAMGGVTMTLTGDHAPDDNTMTTGDDGMYEFGGLRKGDYTVTLTNPDADAYSFPTTSRSMNLSVGQKQTGISFAGEAKRRASISGQVHAEGDAIAGVTVTLSGKADGEQTTGDNGMYNFRNLAAGTYVVEISGWDADAYNFESVTTTRTVKLGNDGTATEDFAGKHTRTAEISGNLFLDEVDSDGDLTDGEPNLNLEVEIQALRAAGALPEWVTGIPLVLEGPGVDDRADGMADAKGNYLFEGLRKGTYKVSVNRSLEVNDDDLTVNDLLADAGYRYSGMQDRVSVTVEPDEKAKGVNFPFRITKQTIHVGAVMGNAETTGLPVGGATLVMYPTAEDATNDTNPLGKTTTDKTTGMAKFEFERENDHGPRSKDTDHLVFIKVGPEDTGHKDLAVSGLRNIEVKYAATERRSMAPTAVRMLNTRANFQWKVMSDETARHGDQDLGYWESTIGGVTEMTDTLGMASHSASVAVADLPATFTIALDKEQHDSVTSGELWKQSKALTHAHDGLTHPAMNAAKDNDLGTIRVTWTTQTLVVGVYREQDDTKGYIGHVSHRKEDDHRPSVRAAGGMSIEVQKRDERGRWQTFVWDHDLDPKTDPEHPNLAISSGLVKFPHLPATAELAVEIDLGLNRTLVTDLEHVETFGDDLTEDNPETYGSFGADGGGVPVVRLCTASFDTSHEDGDCATFGYQWTTGVVSGRTSPSVSGVNVLLEPVTANHGARGGSGKTVAGRKSFNVRDGTYDISASVPTGMNWAITGKDTHRVWCYHDEFADETGESDRDKGWVGKACPDPAVPWTLARTNLEIRGFVANVDHEFNRVVRGDETYAGAELRATGTGGSFTATVEANGLFRFKGLPQGTYTITSQNGADHEMLRYGPDSITVKGAVASHKYVDVDEQNATLDMPYWDYVNSTGTSNESSTPLNDAVTVGSGSSAVSLQFYNYVLLHKDGTFSGKVTAKGNRADPSAGIAVELRRCLVYTAYDNNNTTEDLTDDTPESCTDDPAFAPQLKQTGRGGVWSFDDLREGYYQVNIAGTGYRRAKLTNGRIDDDGANCGLASDATDCDTERTVRKYDILKGDDAFNNKSIHYYVYDSNLSAADIMTAVSVKGVTAVGGDAVELGGTFSVPSDQANTGTNALGATSAAITYGDNSGQITVSVPTASRSVGSTYRVQKGTGALATFVNPGATGAAVTLDRTRTPLAGGPDNPGTITTTTLTIWITGANGYDDHGYTFTANRTNPAGNQLEGDEISTGGNTAGGGNGRTTSTAFTLSTTNATTSTAIVNFTMASLGSGISTKCVQTVAVYRGTTSNTALEQLADQDGTLCTKHYSLTAATGGTMYRVRMTSEDGRGVDYYLSLTRGSD